jgi:hypothetical protein
MGRRGFCGVISCIGRAEPRPAGFNVSTLPALTGADAPPGRLERRSRALELEGPR